MLIKNKKIDDLKLLKSALESHDFKLMISSYKKLLSNTIEEDINLYVSTMQLIDLNGSDIFNRFDK